MGDTQPYKIRIIMFPKNKPSAIRREASGNSHGKDLNPWGSQFLDMEN